MDKQLIKIAITPEEIKDFEPRMICDIIDAGWDMVHLRHPDATFRDMRNLIEAIPQHYHRKLRLHGHFELLNSFNLGGIHLNRRCPSVPTYYNGPHSRSCHDLDELKNREDCDYVTLSPIFDSISKTGYKAAFDKKILERIDKTGSSGVKINVIALGGVTPDKISELNTLDFDGFAVLGSLTAADNIEDFTARLNEFTNAINNL